MKCLSIRLQPNLDKHFDENDVIRQLKLLGRYPEIDVEEENGIRFIYLNLFSEDVVSLWSQLKQGLFEHDTIGERVRNVSIVVCEKDDKNSTDTDDNDDYLLLFHHDPSETLDQL